MNKKLISLLLIFIVLQGGAYAADNEKNTQIVNGLKGEYLNNDLKRFTDIALEKLENNQTMRKQFIDEVYVDKQIEDKAKVLGLDKTEDALYYFKQMRIKFLTDALVKHHLEAKKLDLIALAKERYEVGKEKYRTRRKIKLAQIFIPKRPGLEAEAKKEIDDIMLKLKAAKPEEISKVFKDLAIKYSKDKRAKQGGLLRKWIYEPKDPKQMTPQIRAVFALEKIGEISPVIESGIGFHIMKLMADTPSVQESYKAVEKQIITEIKKEFWYSEKEKFLATLHPQDIDKLNDDAFLKILKKVRSSKKSAEKSL